MWWRERICGGEDFCCTSLKTTNKINKNNVLIGSESQEVSNSSETLKNSITLNGHFWFSINKYIVLTCPQANKASDWLISCQHFVLYESCSLIGCYITYCEWQAGPPLEWLTASADLERERERDRQTDREREISFTSDQYWIWSVWRLTDWLHLFLWTQMGESWSSSSST